VKNVWHLIEEDSIEKKNEREMKKIILQVHSISHRRKRGNHNL
jgi:hypothetical protein